MRFTMSPKEIIFDYWRQTHKLGKMSVLGSRANSLAKERMKEIEDKQRWPKNQYFGTDEFTDLLEY